MVALSRAGADPCYVREAVTLDSLKVSGHD